MRLSNPAYISNIISFCFVHKKELFEKYNDYFEILELPKSRKSWFIRMYYEYIYFKKYSKDKDIYLWISIHDSSPRFMRNIKFLIFIIRLFPIKQDIEILNTARSLYLLIYL